MTPAIIPYETVSKSYFDILNLSQKASYFSHNSLAIDRPIRRIKTRHIIMPFKPYIIMSEESGALTIYFKSDADYSEPLNDDITVYRSFESKEITGCRIENIRNIIKNGG